MCEVMKREDGMHQFFLDYETHVYVDRLITKITGTSAIESTLNCENPMIRVEKAISIADKKDIALIKLFNGYLSQLKEEDIDFILFAKKHHHKNLSVAAKNTMIEIIDVISEFGSVTYH
jgi:hypothetical protein